MSTRNRIQMLLGAAAILALLTACAAKRAAPEPGGDFSYELPSFGVPLQGVNFEYVMYGVSGLSEMAPIRDEMFDKGRIGLVHIALKDIYRQVPNMEGGSYALVNVLTDVSSRVTTVVTRDRQGRASTSVVEDPELLLIRCDVIKITSTGPTAGGTGAADPLGMFRLDEAGKDRLAAHVLAQLEAQGG
jgi:hypothetical protein